MKYKLIVWKVRRMENKIARMQRRYNKYIKDKYLPAISDEVNRSKTNIDKLNKKYNDYYNMWNKAIQN